MKDAQKLSNMSNTTTTTTHFTVNKQRGYPLKKLLSFTEHANLIRRGGVIATIK